MVTEPRVAALRKSGLGSSVDVSRDWFARWQAFVACAFLNLAPLLYFRFIPSNDGPTHVYNAAMLRLFWFAPGGAAGNVFVWNASLPPNLLTHTALALFMSVLSPVTAERVLVVLYALLLPIAFRYFLRSVSSRTYGIEYLSLVWVYNSHLHWGFYNFLFSVILFLFASGYWLRNRHKVGAKSIATLALLATLLYLSHPVGLIEFWIVCCSIALFERVRNDANWSGVQLLLPALAISGALYLHCCLSRIPAAGEITDWPGIRYASSLLFTFSPLASYSASQRVIAMAVPVVVVALALIAVKRERLAALVNPFFFTALITAALVFLAPSSTGGGTMLTPRLVYVPAALACAWLVSREWQLDFRNFLPALGIVLAVAMIASNWPYYSRYDAHMTQFLSAESRWPTDPYLLFRPAGPATLLLDNSRTPFISSAAVGYLAAERRQVLIGDYQAARNYFPLQYRPSLPEALYSSVAENRCPAKDLEAQAASGTESLPIHAAIVVLSSARANSRQCFDVPPGSRFEASGVEFLYYRLPSAESAVSLLR